MRITVLLAAMIMFSFAACKKSSQDDPGNNTGITVISESSVPQAVRTGLATNFTGASEVEWHRSSDHFVSQFNHNSQRHQAGFDDNGHPSSHSIICLDAPVPQVVLDAFRQRFPTDNVYEWKLRNDGTWRAHFMRESIKFEATYSASGTFIKFEQA